VKFITFDTETTGTDPEVDRLVELAGVCRGFDHFSTLVNPERDIPPEARAIHHIGPEDIEWSPFENEALGQFRRHFTSEVPDRIVLVAHNAKFDRGFIRRIDPVAESSVDFICTMRCAWLSWPDAPGYSNQVLRYWLGLENLGLPPELFPHRALYDAIVTQGILEELLKKHPVETLLNWSNNPVLMPKVPYGKHKGKKWDEVDYGYLKWALGPGGPKDDEDFIFTAQYWMNKLNKSKGWR
jgi:exodeoxyribonuclease X